MPEQKYLTRAGLKKLEEELEHLRNVRRIEVANRLHQAVEDGELLENAEYEAAKNEQAFVEGRIITIEIILSEVKIIEDSDEHQDGIVSVGSKVKIQEDKSKPEIYTIVGAAEANPAKGLISNESPLGKALLGRKQGDEIKVNAPSGMLSFRVVAID